MYRFLVKCLGTIVIGMLIGTLINNLNLNPFDDPYDDSDNPETKEHSGFTIYTDHLTGCQYLRVGSFGAITPRLDGDKNQVGCR